MKDSEQIIRLTEFSKGAGCGCKISPKVLQQILTGKHASPSGKLLVGNNDHDDAAVYDLGNGTGLIATTDFFMPIIDDPEAFGKTAAANAISDVYAMGGKPVMALAILGWPEKLPPSVAGEVLKGAREKCAEAGIPLAGGHSIESEEPIFGLSVNGIVDIKNLKKNNTAQEGDLLFITKPIGLGILSTAQKRKVIDQDDVQFLTKELTALNSIGEELGKIAEVTAMTDVTGFGIAGHLIEMAESSGHTAILNYGAMPVYAAARKYLKQHTIPDATYRNWQSYGDHINIDKRVDVVEAFSFLPDPQTNGGLLFSLNPGGIEKVEKLFSGYGLSGFAKAIGEFIAEGEKRLLVRE